MPYLCHWSSILPHFIIDHHVAVVFVCNLQAGNYSCLVAEFHLYRLLGFHLVQSYLPTILMVVISWVSFWMDVNSVPGRVTLGITTLLTVSSKATSKWRVHVQAHSHEKLPINHFQVSIHLWQTQKSKTILVLNKMSKGIKTFSFPVFFNNDLNVSVQIAFFPALSFYDTHINLYGAHIKEFISFFVFLAVCPPKI